MKLKTNIIIGAIFALLLAFVYFHEIRGGQERRQAAERSKQLLDFNESEVERLALIKTSGWIILNDHGGVMAIGEQRGKNRPGPIRYAPDRRSVVKRIGHGRGQRQLCTQTVGGGGTRTRQLKPPRLGYLVRIALDAMAMMRLCGTLVLRGVRARARRGAVAAG